MKKIILVFTLVLSISTSFTVRAQIDTSFWFAAPWVTPDHWYRDPIKLHISTFSVPTTTVRVRQPAAIAPNKYDTTIVIPANSNFDYIFWRDAGVSVTNLAFDSLETKPADVVVPYGLYISSTSNITLVYDVITRVPNIYNPETFSLKGQNGLGLEFICPFQTQWFNQFRSDQAGTPPGAVQPKQQINIVASKPNTVVWITPKCSVVGHLANVSYSIMLVNSGDAYTVENLVQNTNVPGNNLSGTTVVADKPISVTVADDSVRNGGGGCFDLIGDQIVPVDAIGTNYIVNKGAMYVASTEGVYIVATESVTSVNITDAVTTTTLLNKGDTYFYNITQPLTYVEADKNIYVWQASGIGCEAGAAILPPISCAGSNLVSFSRTSNQQFFLNILCKNGSQSTFTLNNSLGTVTVPISAGNFTLVPGTNTLSGGPFYGTQINLTPTLTLPVGSYTIANSTDVFGLGVFGGDFTTGGTFHYMSSFLQRVTLTTPTLVPLCISSTNTVALTATVSGGAASGIWSTALGTGTFAPYISSLANVSTVYTLSDSDTLLSNLKFYFISIGNCKPIKDSTTLQINQRPLVSVGNGLSMCKNAVMPIILTGTVVNALGATWSGGYGGTFGVPSSNTTYTPSTVDIAVGTISLSLLSQGVLPGCDNAVKTVTVVFLNTPTVVISPINYSVCAGNSATLTASGALSYTWSTNIISASVIVTPTVSFVFSVTGSNFEGCVNGNTIQIIVNPLPTVNIAGTNSICHGFSLALVGSGASTYTWNTNLNTSTVIVSPSVTTTYTLRGSDVNNCENFTTKTITVNPLPIINVFSSNSVICSGESSNISAIGALTYSINLISMPSSTLISPSVTTTYSISGTNLSGCVNSTTITQLVSECLGVNTLTHHSEAVLVYPNPNSGEFTIEVNEEMILNLLSELGQVLKKMEFSKLNRYKINIANLAKGVYFINGTKNNRVVNQKIIVTE
jgi:hypothetical protein